MMKEELIVLQEKIRTLRAEGKYKETIDNCYDLILNGEQFNDHKSLLIAYMNMAASYYCVGDIEAAFNSIDSHKKICDKYGEESDILGSYNVLFILYEYNKDLENAKNTLEKTIRLGKKLKKYNIVSNGYSNYSHVCMIEKDYNKAFEVSTIGLEMAKLHRPVTPILELRVKLNIAKALIGLKKFNASKSLIDEMINCRILDSFIREKAQCYDLQGHWYISQKSYAKAFDSFSQAKKLAESYNDVYLLKLIQEERCKLCELMEDIHSGYKIQKEYITLLNDINKRELELVALKLQIKHNIASIEMKANTDYLTGIYNRNYMETTTNKLLNQAYEDKESIICMVFDLDGFKSINDQYGHLFGDKVLKQVSKACACILKGNGLFARFGGDEFVIVLKGISLKNGEEKAEEILFTIRNLNIHNEDKYVPITISIGVTDNLTCAARCFDELFNSADLRLYRAKNNGRNQICATSQKNVE